jgi:hypothetical protein
MILNGLAGKYEKRKELFRGKAVEKETCGKGEEIQIPPG